MAKEDIVKTFFASKRNCNCVLELEESLLSENEDDVISSICCIKNLFTEIHRRNVFNKDSCLGENEEKFMMWLLDRYKDFVNHLMDYLLHHNEIIQKSALTALMGIYQAECKFASKSTEVMWRSPSDFFERIMSKLLSEQMDQSHLTEELEKILCYDDVKFYTLKALLNVFSKVDQVTDVFLENCFHFVCEIKFPNQFTDTNENSAAYETVLFQTGTQPQFCLKEKSFRKLFSSVWYKLLKQLPVKLHKSVLLMLPEVILPHFQNPSCLTDFLTEAYHTGGVNSLLALKSLYFLMEKCNVDYPDFFTKLYALFNEKIINGKFSGKLFRLSNLFLSSTHLPSNIVAAFVKRLSRLSLYSKTNVVLVIIPFVCNLLIRHPGLQIMINRSNPQELSNDPYDFNETDPSKTNAMESSLWEIKSLQKHVYADVARKAHSINKPLSGMECNISSLLPPLSYSVYEKERNHVHKSVPVAVQKPSELTSWWIL